MSLPLALSFLGNLIVGLFILICAALILIVLLQKGRGGGIGAAFGGGGAGSLLGTKTGDFLTWVTICLVALFLVLAVLMGKFMGRSGSSGLEAPIIPSSETVPAPESTAPEGTATPAEEGAPETPPATEPAAQPAQNPAGVTTETAEIPAAPAAEPAAEPVTEPSN